ncbi:MAG: DUF4198 domain-containing protein [Saprospiraceae bacterium]
MKNFTLLFAAFLLFCSHDMFLKLDNFFLSPNTDVTLELYNGTFEKSENSITRDRMIDVSLVGNGKRIQVDTTQWTDRDSTATLLNFKTGAAGTWVAGLSTYARNIEMTGEAFNDYLEHDGVLDMIELRKKNNTLEEAAIEKYSKHVKAIFQVGEQQTDDWQTVLGYPIEFVPMSNPYAAKVGDNLAVKLLRAGQPLANQLIYAGVGGAAHEHSHEEGEEHDHHGITSLRTDANGVASLKLTESGNWYLRTIHLVETEEEGLTHESNWATLTFGVKGDHQHGAAGHQHADDGSHTHADGTTHSHSHGLPTAVYWVVGLLLAGGLFFYSRRKK